MPDPYGDEALGYLDAQTFVSAQLSGSRAARDVLFDFVDLGAPNHAVERLLVNTRVHYRFARRRLELLTHYRDDVAAEHVAIKRIEQLLTELHGAALATIRRGVHDGTLVPAEAFTGADAVENYLRDYPAEAAATRARLGFAPERVRDMEGAVRRGVIGRFAYLMRELVPDRRSHPQKVATLLCTALRLLTDYQEVRDCLRDYEGRLRATGA
jgi:hypothetical protein